MEGCNVRIRHSMGIKELVLNKQAVHSWKKECVMCTLEYNNNNHTHTHTLSLCHAHSLFLRPVRHTIPIVLLSLDQGLRGRQEISDKLFIILVHHTPRIKTKATTIIINSLYITGSVVHNESTYEAAFITQTERQIDRQLDMDR